MVTHLLGPEDPDNFRVAVGRFKERHYTDPLPGCALLPNPDPEWTGPAITTVKKASGADWSAVSIRRIASHDGLAQIAEMPTAERYDRFNSINRNGLNTAGGRGTIVHLWAEDMLAGLSPRTLTDTDMMAMSLPTASLSEAQPYLPALIEFFERYQPEPIAKEAVCIHRDLQGVGYGGTADLFAKVAGSIVVIDWKTRTATSNHGAYAEEAAQVAALAGAQYMIVRKGNLATRELPPRCDHGLIVSIKPGGCKLYEIDLELAFDHWQSMHRWWIARRSETQSIKAARTKNAAPPTAGVERQAGGVVSAPPAAIAHTLRDQIIERMRWLLDNGHTDNLLAIWPDGIPGLKTDHRHSDSELNQIGAALTTIESLAEAPFHRQPTQPARRHTNPPVTATAEIDEGPALAIADLADLTVRYSRVTDSDRATLREWAAEANSAGASISVTQRPHQRRYLITEALIAWSFYGIDRDVIGHTLDKIGAPAANTIGERLGRITIDQAQQLGQTARGLIDGTLHIMFDEAGCTITNKETH